MNPLFLRAASVLSLAPAGDYNDKKGYLVTTPGNVATLSASATVPARAVILEGGVDADSKVTIAYLGGIGGTVPMKASGNIAAGDRVQQAADGTIITDAGPGNARVVVGVACEDAIAGDIIEVAPLTPTPLA